MEYCIIFLEEDKVFQVGFPSNIDEVFEMIEDSKCRKEDIKIVRLSPETAKNVQALWEFFGKIGSDFHIDLLNGLAKDIAKFFLE